MSIRSQLARHTRPWRRGVRVFLVSWFLLSMILFACIGVGLLLRGLR